MGFEDYLKVLRDTPLPTILVIGGILFLLLSVLQKVGASIEPKPGKERFAITVGFILLLSGISLYLVPPSGQAIPTPTQTIESIPLPSSAPASNTGESTNWAVTLEYRVPIDAWSVGVHEYTLAGTCPGSGGDSITNSFMVSENYALLSGDIYLRWAGLRKSKTYGAEAVDGINPSQPSVAVITWDQITQTQAEWIARNCKGTVSWDGSTAEALDPQVPFQH